MTFKPMLAPLALIPMLALAAPAAAAPVKATILYSSNKTVVIDTDTAFPVKALWDQIAQATGLDARYLSVQVLAPKPGMLRDATSSLESLGIYTDFRAYARLGAAPNF